jgi:hypothetical protein
MYTFSCGSDLAIYLSWTTKWEMIHATARPILRGVAQPSTRAPTLTGRQLALFREQGFLAVTEPFFAERAVTFARERVDLLFDRWSTLPRRLAPTSSASGAPPAIARIHRPTALDPAISYCELVETCRALAMSILQVNKVWRRFDGAVYKHPGAGDVDWHQDFAQQTMGAPKRSVHFWIPLNDHAANSGTLLFVPGSHQIGLGQPRRAKLVSLLARGPAPIPDEGVPVGIPLSLGNFSIHTPWTTHGSRPNFSQEIRKALVLEFSPGPWSAARQIAPAVVTSRGQAVRSVGRRHRRHRSSAT